MLENFTASSSSLKRLRAVLSRPDMRPARLLGPAPLSPRVAAQKLIPELDGESAKQLHMDLLGDHEFFDTLNRNMFAVRGRRLNWDRWNEFLYILVRALKPSVFIETGVFDGASSAVILSAMRHNATGTLVSIDLPAVNVIASSTSSMEDTNLPAGKQPGWLIPDSLRGRHRLELGDSALLLPRILDEYPAIDIFMHDSLHTFEHMQFEYRTAWPKIRPAGCLLSDDILWNAAFARFCKQHRRSYVRVAGFGAVRK